MFTNFKEFENVDPLTFFELISSPPTRGHSLKIVRPRCRLDVRKFSFAHKVEDMWNSLDELKELLHVIPLTVSRMDYGFDTFLYGRGFISFSASFPRNYYTILRLGG